MAGIPLVSSTWMQACKDQNRIVMPADSMWVQSLPVRSATSDTISATHYGVTKIAATASHGHANQSLRNTTVHLCGTFSRPPKADVQLLLREAGAKLSFQTSSTVAALKNLGSNRSHQLVFICDDACTDIPDEVQRQVKASFDNNGSNTKQQVLIVSPQWLFDSVAAGVALPRAAYPPAKKKSFRLWNMIYSSE